MALFRQHGSLAGALAACVVALACSPAAPDRARERPDIVLISLDSVRADTLTFRDAQTASALTGLARGGTVFENAASGTSWTLPAHVQMLSGAPPSLHGVVADDLRIDHSEFVEAVTELQELRAGEAAVDSLNQLVTQYTEQDEGARIVVACRALANALLKRCDVSGCVGCARPAASGPRLTPSSMWQAVLRTEILRRAGAERLVDLAGSKSLIGLGDERDLRFVKLRALWSQGSAGNSVLALDMDDGTASVA